MRRDSLIDQLYEVIRMHVPITRAAYGNSLCGWDIEPVVIHGEQIGVCLMFGHEIHVQLDRAKTVRCARRVIREVVACPLRRLGFLTTTAAEDDIPFLARLGFRITEREGRFTKLRLDHLAIQ